MDRGSKRKDAPAASPDAESRTSKRQKLPTDLENGTETPESTTEMGLRFLDSIKLARDKTGRPIATPFLALPKAEDVPGYYDEVKLPMALDIIGRKLKNKEYPTLAALEGDVKRMVQNAKNFNEKTSPIFLDAERVRKTASNWMVKFNPAYREPGYTAVATPIPGETVVNTPKPPAAQQKLKITNTSRASQETPTSTRSKRVAAREPIPETILPSKADLAGKSLQEAQVQIIEDLKAHQEDGVVVFEPFFQYPPRSLKDYYHMIKYPVALNAIAKKAKGEHGRGGTTGISQFPTWDAFEEEVSFIWRNARDYNEDGSDIYNLAGEFEITFNERLIEAKKQLPDQSHQTLKLKMSAPKPASLKLRLGAKASPAAGSPAPGTPAGRTSATPGVIVDSGALARQQQHVEASINGHRQESQRTALSRSASGSGSAPPINGVQAETRQTASPKPILNGTDTQNPVSSVLGLTAASMRPPPHMTPRPPSGSPYPNHIVHQGLAQTQNHHASSFSTEGCYRMRGHETVLPNIQLSTHPSLQQKLPWRFNISAHPQLAQQSVTCTLPASQHFLQLVPTIPVANSARPWRLFVHVNGTKLAQAVRNTDREREKDQPPFDVKLNTGVNRIDVEILAGSEQQKGKKDSEEVLREVCTIFVNVLRQ